MSGMHQHEEGQEGQANRVIRPLHVLARKAPSLDDLLASER